MYRGSEFSSYEIELRNLVTQNDVTLRVANSKTFIEILLLSYLLDFVKYQIKLRVTNSKIKLLFFYFRFTNSKSKNKKLHIELPTRSQKLKVTVRVTNSKVKLLLFRFRVTNSRLKYKNIHFELLTRWVNFYFLTLELRT